MTLARAALPALLMLVASAGALRAQAGQADSVPTERLWQYSGSTADGALSGGSDPSDPAKDKGDDARRQRGTMSAPPVVGHQVAGVHDPTHPFEAEEQSSGAKVADPSVTAPAPSEELFAAAPALEARAEQPLIRESERAEARQTAAALAVAADERLKARDYAGAVVALSRALAADSSDPALWLKRAQAQSHLKQYEQARGDAWEALQRAPESSRAWELAGYTETRLGRWKEALEASENAARYDQANAEAHYVHYLAAGHAGDLLAAVRALERAARLKPKVYGALDERVRRSGKFEDPAEDDLGEEALPKRRQGRPLWPLGALALVLGAAAAAWARRADLEKRLSGAATVAAGAAGRRRLAGKYEIKHLLGRGGMGDVYEAYDESLARLVAIKKLSNRQGELPPNARQLLVQEARTVAAVHHPSIVDIYEIVDQAEGLYLVFEYVRGQTAQQWLARRGPMPLRRAADVLKPVCEALEFAHNRGLVHRDLKPANIMITDEGHVKLMDFGIARTLGTRTTQRKSLSGELPASARTSWVCGTPQYMPPEAETGVVSHLGDVYALGICLYELLTARVPFTYQEQKLALEYAPASQTAPGLPAGVDALIGAALAPDPKRRLGGAADFGRRLRALADAGASLDSVPAV